MTGMHPVLQVDHRNKVKDDNRWFNLREANQAQQNGNKLRQRNNTSGHTGVQWFKPRNKWRAILCRRYIGYFDTPEEAAEAYQRAAKAHFGSFLGR
jgi:hypothetical protein